MGIPFFHFINLFIYFFLFIYLKKKLLAQPRLFPRSARARKYRQEWLRLS